MTDLHCHILPGVDDGARDFAEAGAMLDLARQQGTRMLAATPHSDLRYPFDSSLCRDLVAELQNLYPDGPRLVLGCEVHLTPENIKEVVRHPATYTLNGGDCLLLELPDRISPQMVNPAVDELISAGLRIIIAHPERNAHLSEERSYLDRLVEGGCYLQLTGRSLDGGFGRKAASTAAYILKRRIAHFIASDAHRITGRRPGLATAFAWVARTCGERAARTLFIDNPEAAIAGSTIHTMPTVPGCLASLFTRSAHVFRKHETEMP